MIINNSTNKNSLLSYKMDKVFLHGGDYNPDQWLKHPDVLEKDVELMKKAGVNVVSLGIFAWAAIEPCEGQYEFEWMDSVINRLHENGIYVILATPSGARPLWLAKKYPEVLRTNNLRQKMLFGDRHNHCYSSPVYREKVYNINRMLAQRYSTHPAVIMWHISNEYGGDCHCPLCQAAFQEWLKKKYQNIDRLNESYWSAFWSQSYPDFSDVQSPSPIGSNCVNGLIIDWQRFVTHQTTDFMKLEIRALRNEKMDLDTIWPRNTEIKDNIDPNIPVTNNFMERFKTLDYAVLAQEIDVISWDSYPWWHNGSTPANMGASDTEVAMQTSFWHDLMRSFKNKPFMLMESTPSMTNWQAVSKLKRPGVHMMSSLLAVAHGSDTVQYFQWRKGRGGFEKLHGAVVDHDGSENHRVFKDVAELGKKLAEMSEIAGTDIKSEVAIVFDWENWWAIECARGPRNCGLKYIETLMEQYRYFWEQGISVDIITMNDKGRDLSGYKLVIAPMLYMVRNTFDFILRDYVKSGGTLVVTYWSGIVDEHDLCYLGGFPGGALRDVLGIRSEEIDSLYDGQHNKVVLYGNEPLRLQGVFRASELCDLIYTETAEALAEYTDDFYAGRPALTVNSFGNGKAYYIASRNEVQFAREFYGKLSAGLGIAKAIEINVPSGISVTSRCDADGKFIFVINLLADKQDFYLPGDYKDFFTGETVEVNLELKPYEVRVLVE